jgi:hypothetical protein
MQLTQKNLETHGWLFSPSLRLMVREHETNSGWNVKMDSYTNRHSTEDPRWEFDNEIFDAADSVPELIAAHQEIKVRDWVSGNTLKFF